MQKTVNIAVQLFSWELRFQNSSNYSLTDEWFAMPKLLVQSKLWFMSNACFPSGSMELWYVLCNRCLCDQLKLYLGHWVSNKLLLSKIFHMPVCLGMPDSKRPHRLYAAHQALLSMEFSRQEYWSGLPFPPQGIFPTQGYNPHLLHCRQILTAKPRGKPPQHFTCFVTVYDGGINPVWLHWGRTLESLLLASSRLCSMHLFSFADFTLHVFTIKLWVQLYTNSYCCC